MLHVKNHPRLSGSIITLVPGTMVGLKMKGACYVDRGWRVLTCLCANTRPCSERDTSLWAGDGGERSPRVGENICSVREGVSACVRMCHSIPVCTCAWVIIHNTVGGVTVIRRKETIHWKPLLSTPPPTELLLIPTAGFLSEAPARGWPSKRWYNRVCAPQTNREVRWASQGENRAYTHKQA